MPYKTTSVDAELLLEHKGVSVYHTYDDDDIELNTQSYHYVLNQELNTDESFYVRELSTWTEPEHPPFLTGNCDIPENKKAWEQYRLENKEMLHIKAVIIAAIDKGELKPYEPNND